MFDRGECCPAVGNRRRAARLVLSFVIVAGAPTAQDESATLALGEAGKKIVEWAEAASSAGFSGAVLAAKDGEVIAAVGVGNADIRGKQSITPDCLFEIASVTKSFTAVAAMTLVRDGLLDLDEPFAEYLPGVPEDCQGITVRQLLNHTSGIPRSNSKGSGTNLRAVLKSFLDGGPRHTPGAHFGYWNQGYALLSEVIARAAGDDYTDYCRAALFEPAGLKATLFTGDKAPRRASVAMGRSSRGSPRSALEHPYGAYGFQYRGMGGIVTSVWDLWRWDRALASDVLLDDALKEHLFTPGLGDYALGWYVKRTDEGLMIQSHGGSVRGFTCDVRRYPELDACLFVLCNRDDIPAYQVAQGLQELLFDIEVTVPVPPAPLDDKLAKALEGEYGCELGNRLVIERDEAVVRSALHWAAGYPTSRGTIGLTDDGTAVLFDWTDSHSLELTRRRSGKVRSVRLLGRQYKRRS